MQALRIVIKQLEDEVAAGFDKAQLKIDQHNKTCTGTRTHYTNASASTCPHMTSLLDYETYWYHVALDVRQTLAVCTGLYFEWEPDGLEEFC